MTFRALAVGMCVGAVLATTNVYLGLRTGWWDSGGITAAVLAFAVLSRARRTPFTPSENVLAQTMASAAAAMPAAVGVLGALPALAQLGHALRYGPLFAFGLTMGLGGLALAVLLREQMLEREKLPFPSGIAIAEVVTTLHQPGARAGASPLFGGAVVGAGVTWLRDGALALVPQVLWVPARVFGFEASALSLGVGVSPLLLGLGAMMGPLSGAAVAGGACLAWGGVAPLLLRRGLVAGASYPELVSWLLWPGAALMLGGGLTAFLSHGPALARALSDLRRLEWRRGWRGTLGIAAAGAALLWLSFDLFGLAPWASLPLLALSVLAAGVCVRVAGEAALAPIGQLAEVVQLGAASVLPGAAANVGGGALVSGTIVEAAQLSESFKVGALTGVAPGALTRAAAWGVLTGAAVTLPVFALLARAHPLGSSALPAPGAVPWRAIAELARAGAGALPPGAARAAAVAALGGVGLELLRQRAWGRWLPSPMLVGLACVLPATTSFTLAVGSLTVLLFRARARGWQAACAGAVAGESLVGLAMAVASVGGASTP